jgi:hypothetical protein
MGTIDNPVEYAKTAVEAYRSLYGADLISIILYGSAVSGSGDFDAKRSDINLLIVLASMDIELIAKSSPLQERFNRKRFGIPLFMDKAYIAGSLDSYPMELLDIKQNSLVLFGEDVLSRIAPAHEHLRLQAERELKGKWLHLLKEFSVARKSITRLRQLAGLSLKSFLPVFRSMLTLKNTRVPSTKKELLEEIESVYAIAGKPFRNIAEACSGGNLPELETRFIAYSKAIKSLIDRIENT